MGRGCATSVCVSVGAYVESDHGGGIVTGYVAWTCNGCRDMHYMREPMYAGGLCRRCADRADCAPKTILAIGGEVE